jgi:hypothetical protein
MLTAESSSIELYQKLCKVVEELEEYRSIAENIGAEKAVSEKEKAICERDEAREKAERYRLEANAMMAKLHELQTYADKLSVGLPARMLLRGDEGSVGLQGQSLGHV